ncbi:rhodanese-like domain-containing protein [Pseudothauera nasutitermitis]|uniref:Rhodanese-like domain-containing protein n=1 Tax=Pseudothauera nasutitermitis TaxID=2565930 RepID=A0A4S4B517_9RHOO|nr:rhodanese-like domain-containing protein [Pseudothauera nasutitermitis]THF67381.1 rhodanese-like domain-containing protein [Pseudothauera nasutitermitis]
MSLAATTHATTAFRPASQSAGTRLHPTLEGARQAAIVSGLGYAGNVTPAEAWALHQQGGVLLIDVRTAEELRDIGRVEGAQHLPWAIGVRMERNPYFLDRLADLIARDEPVLLLCRSGKRSVAAARTATEAGYSLVFNVLEGFEGDRTLGHGNGWQQRGLPWTRD